MTMNEMIKRVLALALALTMLLGCGLGLFYGFLRPLRPKRTALSDLLFLPAMGYAWLYLGFAVCRGDLRLGYFSGLALGALAWESTIGKVLRPVFSGFWRIFALPFQKISHFFKKYSKNYLHSAKKWLQ